MLLTFNGNPLPAGVNLIELQISSPQVSRRTIDVPDARGLIRTGGKLGARAVKLRYAIVADTLEETMQVFHALCRWCMTDEPAPLILPGYEDRYILAECQLYPNDDIGANADGEITFQCDLPEFQSVRVHRTALRAGANAVRIGGDLSTPAMIELTIPSDRDALALWVDGHKLEFSGDIEAGAVRIDTERGTVTLNEEDIAPGASLDSDLRVFLRPGVANLTLPADVTGALSWRDRWI